MKLVRKTVRSVRLTREKSHAPSAVVFSLVLIVCSASGICRGQSLWQRRDLSRVNLFANTNAIRVGDLLTVVIQETTDVENKDVRAMKQDRSRGATFGTSGSAAGNPGAGGSMSADFDYNTGDNKDFNGDTRVSVAREFSDRITVNVLDILPNGNLVIGGKRTRKVSGETRQLVISGIVRPIDISEDNTVTSPLISNFQVNYAGRGPETVYTSNNWFIHNLRRFWIWN